MSKTYPMKCRISAEGGVTRVEIYDDIGEGSWFSDGISAKGFAAQLAAIKGPLDVHINSYGGDVADGVTIASNIRSYKGFKKTVVDGFACSIASVIAQAGDERVMQPGSMMMIHDALSLCVGNAAEMRGEADVLDKHSDNIASIYAGRAGGSVEQWRDTMRATAWYTADEAVAAGLADRVGDGKAAIPAGLDLDVAAFEMIPGRIAARLRALPQAQLRDADGEGGGEDEDGESCPTCEGTGKIRQGKMACPDCDGTGKVPEDGDGPEDRSPRFLRARDGRLLGLESMPLADKALPVHHTAVTDVAWDGPAAVAAMPNDDTVLKYCHAWESDEAASVPHREGDDDADDQKGNYKFPHHTGKGAAANLAACRNGLARLSGADIPDSDRAGVEAHLRAHLADGGSEDDGADDHAHPDLSGIDLEQFRSALRGATA